MDKEVFSSNKGRLLSVSEGKRVKVSALRLTSVYDIEIETTWETEDQDQPEGSWTVIAARECLDYRTGDKQLFLLTKHACVGRESSQRVKLFRLLWTSSVFSHTSCSPPVELLGELVSSLEIPLSYIDLQETNISLVYGTVVMCVSGNEIILYHIHDKTVTMNRTFLYEQNERTAENGAGISTSILASESEDSWAVTVVLQHVPAMTGGGGPFTFVTVFALDKKAGCKEFRKSLLDTRQFIPQEYASKIACFSLLSCRRHLQPKSKETDRKQECKFSYDNSCIIGLTDGYVLVFDNGCMKLCVSLIGNLEVLLQSPAAVDQVDFVRHADVLICHTSSKKSFVVNIHTSKVVHQWQNVAKQWISDFLQCGSQQLLLLFDGWSPQKPQTNFLLTDFQGLVVDKRPVETRDSFFSRAKDVSSCTGSIQHAFRALQAQNQDLLRAVAEEEQRLRTKTTFLAETWKRLQALTLGHSASVQHPEVPLVTLLGTQWKESSQGAVHQHDLSTEHPACVKVLLSWHRIIDSTCVVGIQVLNTSARELHDPSLVLSSSASDCATVPGNSFSASTKTWQCFTLFSQTCLPDEADKVHKAETPTPSGAKRRRVNQASIRQIDVIRPTETVTVTCCFLCPSFAHQPEREYAIHLRVTDSNKSEKQQLSDEGSISAPGGGGGGGDGGDRSEERDCTSVGYCDIATKTKFVFCGKIVFRVSEVLQQNGDKLWNSLSSEDVSDSQFEEAALTIHAMQDCWELGISFVLHEASTLSSCLQKAGLVCLPRLGQYICSKKSPVCLNFVRVKVVKDTHLHSRETRMLVFARGTDQLMLFLRHLYSHLPEDATITAASTDKMNTNILSLTTAMASELRVLRQEARTALQAHRNNHSERLQDENCGGTVQQRENTSDLGLVRRAKSNSKQGVSGQDDSLQSEAEEFAQRQRRLQQSHKEIIKEELGRHLLTAVEVLSLQTDEIVAQVYGGACFE